MIYIDIILKIKKEKMLKYELITMQWEVQKSNQLHRRIRRTMMTDDLPSLQNDKMRHNFIMTSSDSFGVFILAQQCIQGNTSRL